MDDEVKKLKIEGVAPKTPPTSDSEDDLNIEEIRDHRKDKAAAEKIEKKEFAKKQIKEFRVSLVIGYK